MRRGAKEPSPPAEGGFGFQPTAGPAGGPAGLLMRAR